MDQQQPWQLPRALRHCALRYGSDETEPDGEIANQAESGPFLYRFSRAHRRAQAADNLLLRGVLRQIVRALKIAQFPAVTAVPYPSSWSAKNLSRKNARAVYLYICGVPVYVRMEEPRRFRDAAGSD